MRDYKQFISDIIESIDKIRDYTSSLDYDEFINDSKTYDAVLQNLLIIGEAANSIPDEIQQSHSDIDWRGIIGMRNIIVHGYFKVNPGIIWKTINENLPKLKDQINKF